MSKIALQANNSGTGTFTIASPDSNTNRLITLPDFSGSIVLNQGIGLFTITSSGAVGIGTTSPTANLTIGSTAPRLDFQETGGSVGFDNTTLIRDADVFAVQTRNGGTFVSNDYRITTNAFGALTHEWRIGNTERMRIDSSGTTSFTGNAVPSTTNLYDLGSTSLRWRNIYTQDLHLSNGIGDYTVVEGVEDLFLVNNKTGKSFKFALIEVDPSTVPPKSDV